MKLNAIDRALRIFHCCDQIAADGRGSESGRQLYHVVAVAHPRVQFEGKLIKECRGPTQHLEPRVTVFARKGGLRSSALLGGDELHAVTNAEHRDTYPLIKIGS